MVCYILYRPPPRLRQAPSPSAKRPPEAGCTGASGTGGYAFHGKDLQRHNLSTPKPISEDREGFPTMERVLRRWGVFGDERDAAHDFLGTPVNLIMSSQKCQGVPFPQSVKSLLLQCAHRTSPGVGEGKRCGRSRERARGRGIGRWSRRGRGRGRGR